MFGGHLVNDETIANRLGLWERALPFFRQRAGRREREGGGIHLVDALGRGRRHQLAAGLGDDGLYERGAGRAKCNSGDGSSPILGSENGRKVLIFWRRG